jgi:hypothetical protein
VFNWLINGTATVLTNPQRLATLTPSLTAAAVLGGYTVVLLAAATWLVSYRHLYSRSTAYLIAAIEVVHP